MYQKPRQRNVLKGCASVGHYCLVNHVFTQSTRVGVVCAVCSPRPPHRRPGSRPGSGGASMASQTMPGRLTLLKEPLYSARSGQKSPQLASSPCPTTWTSSTRTSVWARLTCGPRGTPTRSTRSSSTALGTSATSATSTVTCSSRLGRGCACPPRCVTRGEN